MGSEDQLTNLNQPKIDIEANSLDSVVVLTTTERSFGVSKHSKNIPKHVYLVFLPTISIIGEDLYCSEAVTDQN